MEWASYYIHKGKATDKCPTVGGSNPVGDAPRDGLELANSRDGEVFRKRAGMREATAGAACTGRDRIQAQGLRLTCADRS
jgi:hypothetical protein